MPIKPYPPISTSPRDEPLICIQVNEEWIKFLFDTVRPFQYPERWSGNIDQNKLSRVYAKVLLDIFIESLGCDDMTACCEDRLRQYRTNPETGEIDVTYDGGETYEPAPDTIYSNAVTPAPLAGEDGDVKRCEAANNIVENLKDVQAGISSKLELTYTLFDLCVTVLVEIIAIVLVGLATATLIALVIPLIPKVIEIVRQLTGLSQAAYNSLFSENVWTTVRCIAYCHVQANGKFTPSGWQAVKSDMKAQLGSGSTTAGANLASMVDVWALVGLNHAAAIGSGAEGNCDDCPCESCDLSLWDTYHVGGEHGVILLQTEDEFIITASLLPNNVYYAIIVSPDNNICCELNGLPGTYVGEIWTVDEAPPVIEKYYNGCGEDIDTETPSQMVGENFCGRMIEWASISPFTVRWVPSPGSEC